MLSLLLLACTQTQEARPPVPDAPVGERVLLFADPGGLTTLRALDARKAPLEGVPVGWETADDDEVLGGYTGADGTLTLVVPPNVAPMVLGMHHTGRRFCGSSACLTLGDEVRQLVTVLTSAGQPVEGAEIIVARPARAGQWTDERPQVYTDHDGLASVYAVPGSVFGARLHAGLLGVGVGTIVLSADELVVYGTVRDAEGAPIDGARVELGAPGGQYFDDEPLGVLAHTYGSVRTGSGGTYALSLNPRLMRRVYLGASKDGWTDDGESFRARVGAAGRRVDFRLTKTRELALRCKGLPSDSCASIAWGWQWVACAGSTPDSVKLFETRVGVTDHLAASCPVGTSAVDLAGMEAQLSPSGATAWLDFTPWSGGIRGQVRDPRPGCRARALGGRGASLWGRSPSGPARDSTPVDRETGRFEVTHLSPGRWTIDLTRCGSTSDPVESNITDTILDLGTL